MLGWFQEWYPFFFGGFMLGFLRLPLWTITIAPAAAFARAAYAVSQEPPSYDMHGFGYYVGGAIAGVCVVIWLLGRGLRAALGRRAMQVD